MKTACKAMASGVFGLAFFAVLLFWPAGTLRLLAGMGFHRRVHRRPRLVPSIYLAVKRSGGAAAPDEGGADRRNQNRSEDHRHRRYLSVVAVLVVSALDHRFGWSQVPTAVVIVGNVLVAVGLGLAQLVVIQNSYAAATITVEAEQQVVSTGLYGLVRHPMYVGALIMMIGTPLALDSYWGLAGDRPALPVLPSASSTRRRCCAQELDGYDEYTHKVHYRLVPGVW